MNWDQIEGRWREFRGTVRSKWGKLTDDDLDTIGGKREVFLGRLQQRYGMQRDQAERELDSWLKSMSWSKDEQRERH